MDILSKAKSIVSQYEDIMKQIEEAVGKEFKYG